MDDQSQKNEMRNAVRGDRKRALERWREEGRAPVFGPLAEREPEPEPEPEVVAPPEPEPQAEVVAPPEPEPAVAEPPEPEPEEVARAGWLRRLFRR